MSRIGAKDTDLERIVRSKLHQQGLRFRKHVKQLPGKPDIVFSKAKIAVFIDGDFWHGYRFPAWEGNLTEFWRVKISKNRERDIKNHRKLRKMGWTVIRVWQHQIKNNLDETVNRIVIAVRAAQ